LIDWAWWVGGGDVYL